MDMSDMQSVTAEDVRELLESGSMDPTLVRWLDTGEVEVVAGVLFGDISYSNYDREHELIVTQQDLRSTGDFDSSNPTDEDCQALAEMLNEG
jgi:hypothetical protein